MERGVVWLHAEPGAEDLLAVAVAIRAAQPIGVVHVRGDPCGLQHRAAAGGRIPPPAASPRAP